MAESADPSIRGPGAGERPAVSGATTPIHASAERDFITALESLRGIAALIVVVSHATAIIAGPDWTLLSQTFWSLSSGEQIFRRALLMLVNGNAAVSLFFVLSGFVLGLSLRRDHREVLTKAGAFAGRRLLRIYPAVAVNLLVMAAVTWTLSELFPAVSFAVPATHELGRNLLLVDFNVNGPTWTMLVELLAIPLLFVTHLVSVSYGMRGLLILMGAWHNRPVQRTHRIPPAARKRQTVGGGLRVSRRFPVHVHPRHLDRGMARAACAAHHRTQRACWARASVVLLLSARACFGFYARSTLLIEGFASGAMIAILAAAPYGAAHRMLEWRPVRFLGHISYSVYLYHALAIGIVTPVLVWVVTGAWLEARPYLTAAATSLAVVLLTLPMAWASYRLVEQPSKRLGRRL